MCLLSNSAAAHPYQNQTWVPLRITDQVWAYWGNVYGPSVVFHHKSLLICWIHHCFVSEVLISTVVKFEKRKKSMSQNGLSLSEENLLWLNEDVTFPRWPPWEFCTALDIKHATVSLRMSYNYSSCQKKSKKSDPGFKFTGQRSFKIGQGVKL